MRAVFATVITALVSLSLHGCGGDGTTTPAASPAPAPPAPSPATLNIVELAQTVPQLGMLVELLVQNDLVTTLEGPGPFTVFAPTNASFAAAAGVIANLTQEQVKEVLLYHVVPGVAAEAAMLTKDESLVTAFNTPTNHSLTVATITPNVTIHPEAGADATVTGPNNMATNGVVHIVDAVLVPSFGPAPAPTPAPDTPTPMPATMNIVELAQSVDSLSTLVTLLVQQNLTETLSGPGPFTVFAPTNAAFDAASNVTAGLSSDQLTNVLLYHVVPSVAAVAADLTKDEDLATAFDTHDLTVATIAPNVTIHPQAGADATVTGPNNMATNGVVHIVDAVLVPTLEAHIQLV